MKRIHLENWALITGLVIILFAAFRLYLAPIYDPMSIDIFRTVSGLILTNFCLLIIVGCYFLCNPHKLTN